MWQRKRSVLLAKLGILRATRAYTRACPKHKGRKIDMGLCIIDATQTMLYPQHWTDRKGGDRVLFSGPLRSRAGVRIEQEAGTV